LRLYHLLGSIFACDGAALQQWRDNIVFQLVAINESRQLIQVAPCSVTIAASEVVFL